MIRITAGDHQIELTSGTRYELETVPKYFVKFPDFTIATLYRSGMVKSIGDVDLATFRTLGGSLVVLETDIKTGGYLTHKVTEEDRSRFSAIMGDLIEIGELFGQGRRISIEYFEQLEYEPDVPTEKKSGHFSVASGALRSWTPLPDGSMPFLVRWTLFTPRSAISIILPIPFRAAATAAVPSAVSII